jgi:DnaJ-domain-containing protein 1
MSIGRRILDGVNSVMDSLAADDTPLSHVDEPRLRAELQARIDARAEGVPGPRDNPRARDAAANPEARKRRHAAADRRAGTVHKERDQRERVEKEARERAFRDFQARAQRQAAGGPRPSSSSSSAGAGSRRSARNPFGRKDAKLIEYYKVLDLQIGATHDEVKASYRKLMRKYHPDRHVGAPHKQKAATELTMRVTQAYNEILRHLKEG